MSVIRIEDIAHVRYAAPDLVAMRGFLEDFGLACFEADGRLYGRASDGRPFVHVTEPGAARFLALGLRAASVDDLEWLAARWGWRCGRVGASPDWHPHPRLVPPHRSRSRNPFF